jgi:hypothetical protein
VLVVVVVVVVHTGGCLASHAGTQAKSSSRLMFDSLRNRNSETTETFAMSATEMLGGVTLNEELTFETISANTGANGISQIS